MQSEDQHLQALLASAHTDVSVTQVRQVSRSEALEMVLQQGRKWQKEGDFKKGKTITNPSAVDLVEISYASLSTNLAGRVFVGHSYGTNTDSHDFVVADVASVFFVKKKPTFVYNHGTHQLTVCLNVKDARITPDRGVEVRGKSYRTTSRMVSNVGALQGRKLLQERGQLPRAASYDGSPAFIYERFRFLHDVWNLLTKQFSIWALIALLILLLLLPLLLSSIWFWLRSIV